MIGWLATGLIFGALLVAAIAGISALRHHGPSRLAVVLAALTALLVAVQAVVAVAVTFGGEKPEEAGLFFGYLVAVVLILPLSVVWARAERSQFGSLVIVVGALVLAVLVVRLQQLWGPAVA